MKITALEIINSIIRGKMQKLNLPHIFIICAYYNAKVFIVNPPPNIYRHIAIYFSSV